MARRGRRKKKSFDPVLSRGIIAVVIFVCAIIIALSFFDNAGWVGVMLNEYILSFLFGSIRYAVPIVMIVLAGFIIRDIDYDFHPMHLIGAGLFFLSLSSVMHLGFTTHEMWRQALDGNGGGIFGMLAWPMKTYVGMIASYVILGGVTLISVFLIFNTSLNIFVFLHQKIFVLLRGIGNSCVYIFKKILQPTNHGVLASTDDTDEGEKTDDEYEESDEEEIEEDEEDHSTRKSLFRKQQMKREREEKHDTKKDDVWSKRVIVKNLPPLTLLSSKRGKPTSGDIKANAETIQDTLHEFNIDVDMGEIRVGPTVTQYSLKPSKGVKLSRITALSNDLALALAAHPIRIEAPIPGKALVGIEVPNEKAAMVTLKELLESKEFESRQHNMMVALGKDVAGKVWFADLPRMPHLLSLVRLVVEKLFVSILFS